MKDYLGKDIRNVVLLGHAGSGKSTIAEASLVFTKVNSRIGKASDGSSTVDFDDEEKRKGQSIFTSIAPIEYKNTKINFIDTPGYLDYEGEKISGLAVADAAIVVVSGKEGVESGTLTALKLINRRQIPTIFFVNKLDDENAHFDKTVDALRENFGNSIVPFSVPDGKGGVIDVIKDENLPDYAADYFGSIKESVAETDDALMDKFFEGVDFTDDELSKGIKDSIKAGKLRPVIFGSAIKGDGIEALLNACVKYFPSYTEVSPKENEPFSALVFKTSVDPFVGKISYIKVLSGSLKPDTALYNADKDTAEKISGLITVRGKTQTASQCINCGDIGAIVKLQVTETNDSLCTKEKIVNVEKIDFPKPMLGVAISPKTKDDEDKMSDALKKVLSEDKSLNFVRNNETGEQVLYAIGDQQIDVVASKLKNRYKVEIAMKEPKVQYRETIRGKSEVQGKYKKQNGGAGQYGDVWVRFEPNPDSEEMVFAEEVFGGAVPKNFFPSVEAGLRSCMAKGPLAGCKVVNVKATLYDGSYHPVDSKPNSFEAAARLAFKAGIPKANPILLEPIGKVTVIAPEEYTGDIIGDFNKRRGMIMNTESTPEGDAKVDAEVPMAEMLSYATELRSMTKGCGSYVIEFDRYEPAPPNVTEKVVAATAADRKDDEDE